MKQKRKIVKANVSLYKNSSKKEKTKILTDLEIITDYSRKYLCTLLNKGDESIRVNGKLKLKADLLKTAVNQRGRKKIYDKRLTKYLVEIWKLSGLISSKHLYFFIKENHEWIFSEGKLKKTPSKDKKLILRMSSSTIERLLKEEKKKQKTLFKYKSRKAAKNHIKKQVDIESFLSRDVKKIGYMEIDLVHHSGNSGKGEFFYTLTAVEVITDWISLKLLRNKAQIWALNKLSEILDEIPYNPYHIHSDNGSEFINAHIITFIKENRLEQTRSRAYRKNDNALVELKNWTSVRAYTGYRRYNTDEEYEALDEILRIVALKHNLFIPTMKKVIKTDKNGNKKKAYEIKTPFLRLLESEQISEEKKRELIELKKSVNLYRLNGELAMYLTELDNAYAKKHKKYDDIKIDINLNNLKTGAATKCL